MYNLPDGQVTLFQKLPYARLPFDCLPFCTSDLFVWLPFDWLPFWMSDLMTSYLHDMWPLSV